MAECGFCGEELPGEKRPAHVLREHAAAVRAYLDEQTADRDAPPAAAPVR